MRTIREEKMARDLNLFPGLLARDAGMAARRQAKADAYYKARMTQPQRELEAVKAQYARDMAQKDKQHQQALQSLQERATQAILDHDLAAGALVTGALFIGYLLAFL